MILIVPVMVNQSKSDTVSWWENGSTQEGKKEIYFFYLQKN